MARQAAFILAASLGLIIICNDVRTDTLLLGTTTCAVWQLAEYLQHNRWRYLIGGFFCIGLAMLAKGPIGMVVPGFAVGTHLLLSGQWRAIFKWQWLVGLLVTALVLAPMCWGLWQQFDLHPEKEVNGRTGVSGLYFFFWEQSFGRVTGENVWRNDASAFYFLHVYLWAFLPWCLLLPGALAPRPPKGGEHPGEPKAITAKFSRTHSPFRGSGGGGYALGGFILTFISMSMSQYKLPHYIFVTLPWAAILVATHLNKVASISKWQWVALYISMFLGLTIAFLLPGFVFPTGNPVVWGLMLTGTSALALQIFNSPFDPDSDKLVQRGVWASVLIGFVVNFHFYPELLPYQVAKPVAKYAREHNIPATSMAYFRRGSHALDFYNGDLLDEFREAGAVRDHAKASGTFWLEGDKVAKAELEQAGVRFEVEQTFHHFQVALLKARFLDPAQRDSTLVPFYLFKILQDQN